MRTRRTLPSAISSCSRSMTLPLFSSTVSHQVRSVIVSSSIQNRACHAPPYILLPPSSLGMSRALHGLERVGEEKLALGVPDGQHGTAGQPDHSLGDVAQQH